MMENTSQQSATSANEELLQLEQIASNLSKTENLKEILIRVTALQRQVFQELDRRKISKCSNA